MTWMTRLRAKELLVIVVAGALAAGCFTRTIVAGPVVTPAAVASIRNTEQQHDLVVLVQRPVRAWPADAVVPIGTPPAASPTGAPPIEVLGKLVEIDSEKTKVAVDHTPRISLRLGPEVTLPNGSIRALRTKDRGTGAVTGLGVGLLLGVTFGALMYLDNSPCPPGYGICLRGSDLAVPAAIVVTPPAMLIGALIGWWVGANKDFEFGPQ